jgi:hypothetical protein
MKKFILLLCVVIGLSGCMTMLEMEKEIQAGFDNAADLLPAYEIMLVPVNEKALELEASKGKEWVVPD